MISTHEAPPPTFETGAACVLLGARAATVSTRAEIARALRVLAPRIPAHEFQAVLDHARDSPGLRGASPETAAWLSLVAYARHVFTDYDKLLQEAYDQESARFFVAAELAAVLREWGVRRPLTPEE
jgi:hypothetical protein